MSRMTRYASIFMMILLLCAMPLVVIAASPDEALPPLTFAPNGEEPVLTLCRQANFTEEGMRSGTLIELYSDKSLLIYALGLLENEEPLLLHAGSVTEEEYRSVEKMLSDGGFLGLPEWIEIDVEDGDTVTLTASTSEGIHQVGAYSPEDTPFGKIVRGIEEMLGAYENTVAE